LLFPSCMVMTDDWHLVCNHWQVGKLKAGAW
jgi:hypothetical protein